MESGSPKGQKDIIRSHALQHGESMNQFVIRAIDEAMQRDTEQGGSFMSDRERAGALLDQIPDHQIRIIIAYMQGMLAASGDDTPNDETIAAIESLERGEGKSFDTVEDLFADLEV